MSPSVPGTASQVKGAQKLLLPSIMLVGFYFCPMGSRSRAGKMERERRHMVLACEAEEESR